MARRVFTNPRTRVKILDRNFSDRSAGSKVQALCVHTTESHEIPGSNHDVESIWNWFNNPQAEASSHYVLDADGRAWQLVSDDKKAWTVGAANSFTINYENIGFAAWSNLTWRSKMRLIRKLAQLIAYHSRKYNIPIRRGKVANQGGVCVCTKTGVITHLDVTRAGFGTHTDPGVGFPMRRVLTLARWYKINGWTPGLAPA